MRMKSIYVIEATRLLRPRLKRRWWPEVGGESKGAVSSRVQSEKPTAFRSRQKGAYAKLIPTQFGTRPGGDGFLVLYCPPERQDRVREALAGHQELLFRFDWAGTRVVFAQ